jgi:hypothetical protein
MSEYIDKNGYNRRELYIMGKLEIGNFRQKKVQNKKIKK